MYGSDEHAAAVGAAARLGRAASRRLRAVASPRRAAIPAAMCTTGEADRARLAARRAPSSGSRAATRRRDGRVGQDATAARRARGYRVPRRGGTPGLSVGKHEDKMGLRGSSTVPLVLDDVELAEDALLGAPGGGFGIAMMALDGGRIGIASQALGIARGALEAAPATRGAGAVRPADRQAPGDRNMLADVATELDAARCLRCARRAKEHEQPFSREAAMAKLFASEAAWRLRRRASDPRRLRLRARLPRRARAARRARHAHLRGNQRGPAHRHRPQPPER